MPVEFVQIIGIRAEGDMFRLLLSRGHGGTLATHYEAGLWHVAASPFDSLARDNPEGLSVSDIDLRFPALKADDASCLVSATVVNWLDVGYILTPVKVVE